LSQVQDPVVQVDPLLIAAVLNREAAVVILPVQATTHREAALPDHQDPPAEVHQEAAGRET